VTFELTGLIPGGVYTLWADYYAAPGLTDDFAHGQALGALGAADGSENTFTAAADGSITFNAIMPAGPLSWFTIEEGFESPSYVLDATVGQFVVWGAYHIDGKTWGPVPDAEGVMDETWVAHFVTVVGPEFPVRQATAPVETSVHLEVGTFVGDEFVKPTEPGQLLFEDHTEARKPVLAPPYDIADEQRHHLTWDDFNNVTGTTTIQETLDGTRVTFKLTGLIPNGVYTLWADFYAAPGLTDDFAHDQAFGALGSPDGSDNTFTAAEDGTITFTVVQPAGPLSWFTFVEGFEAPLYALDAPVAQFVVWGAYHIDGKSWGPYAGQDGAFDETWVGQFVTVVGPDSPVR